MLRKNKTLVSIVLLAGSIAGIMGFFLLIDPEGKPLPIIFVPVLLLWLALYCGMTLAGKMLWKERRSLHTVIVFSASTFLVLLFLLSGVGELTLRDIVLTASLTVVAAFYFYRSWG